MKSQLTFTPEVLTCCTLDTLCTLYNPLQPPYYFTLLVIYERLNTSYILLPAQPEEDWLRTGSEPGFSLGLFQGFCRSREFFLATVLLHLHCLLFGVLVWVSV
jgi:hypothetical protein